MYSSSKGFDSKAVICDPRQDLTFCPIFPQSQSIIVGGRRVPQGGINWSFANLTGQVDSLHLFTTFELTK